MVGAARGGSRARPGAGRRSPGEDIVAGRLVYTTVTLAIVGLAVWWLWPAAELPRVWIVQAALTDGSEFEAAPLNFAHEDLTWVTDESRPGANGQLPRNGQFLRTLDELFDWAAGLKQIEDKDLSNDTLIVYVVAQGVTDESGPILIAPGGGGSGGTRKIADLIGALRRGPVRNVVLVLDGSRTLADPSKNWAGLDFADGVRKLLDEGLEESGDSHAGSLAVIVSAESGQYGISLPGEPGRTLFSAAWERAWSQERAPRAELTLGAFKETLSRECQTWSGGRQTPWMKFARFGESETAPGDDAARSGIIVRTSVSKPTTKEVAEPQKPSDAGSETQKSGDKESVNRTGGPLGIARSGRGVPAALLWGSWLVPGQLPEASATKEPAADPKGDVQTELQPGARPEGPGAKPPVEPSIPTTGAKEAAAEAKPEEPPSGIDRMWWLRDEIEASAEFPMRSPVVFAPHLWRELNSRMLQQDLRYHAGNGSAYHDAAARLISRYVSGLEELRRSLRNDARVAAGASLTADEMDEAVMPRLNQQWQEFRKSGELARWESLDRPIQSAARQMMRARYQLRESALLSVRLSRVASAALPSSSDLQGDVDRWEIIETIVSRDGHVNAATLAELKSGLAAIDSEPSQGSRGVMESLRTILEEARLNANQKGKQIEARTRLEILLTSSVWDWRLRRDCRAAWMQPVNVDDLKSGGDPGTPISRDAALRRLREWHQPLYRLAGFDGALKDPEPRELFRWIAENLQADVHRRHVRACLLPPEFAAGVSGATWMPCRLRPPLNTPVLELELVEPDKKPNLDRVSPAVATEDVELRLRWKSPPGATGPPAGKFTLHYDPELLEVFDRGQRRIPPEEPTWLTAGEQQRVSLLFKGLKPVESPDEALSTTVMIQAEAEGPEGTGPVVSSALPIEVGRRVVRQVELEISPLAGKDVNRLTLDPRRSDPGSSLQLLANRVSPTQWILKNQSAVPVRAALQLWAIRENQLPGANFPADDLAQKLPQIGRRVAEADLELVLQAAARQIPWKAPAGNEPSPNPGAAAGPPAADFEAIGSLLCVVDLADPIPPAPPDKPASAPGRHLSRRVQYFQAPLNPVNPVKYLTNPEQAATRAPKELEGQGQAAVFKIDLRMDPAQRALLPDLETLPFKVRASYEDLSRKLKGAKLGGYDDATVDAAGQASLQAVFETIPNGLPAVVDVDVDGWPRALRYSVETIVWARAGNEQPASVRCPRIGDLNSVRIAAVRLVAASDRQAVLKQFGRSQILPEAKGESKVAVEWPMPSRSSSNDAPNVLAFPGGGSQLQIEIESDFPANGLTAVDVRFGERNLGVLRQSRQIRWRLSPPSATGQIPVASRVQNWLIEVGDLPTSWLEPLKLGVQLVNNDGQIIDSGSTAYKDELFVLFDGEAPDVTMESRLSESASKEGVILRTVRVNARDPGGTRASGIREIRLAKLEKPDDEPKFDGKFLPKAAPEDGEVALERTAEFEVADLKPGEAYWFVAEAVDAAGNSKRSSKQRFVVSMPVPATIPMVTKKDGIIRGKVANPNGKSPDMLTVTLEKGGQVVAERVAINGEFTFSDLDRSAEYTLRFPAFVLGLSKYDGKVLEKLKPSDKNSSKPLSIIVNSK